MVKTISVERGAWVGADTLTGPGVTIQEGAIAAAGGVALKTNPAYEIHSGNPARLLNEREFINEGM